MTRTVAVWTSRGGASRVELHAYESGGYGYTATDGMGFLGLLPSDDAAIAVMLPKLEYLQPDANKTPMKRIS